MSVRVLCFNFGIKAKLIQARQNEKQRINNKHTGLVIKTKWRGQGGAGKGVKAIT